MSDFLDAIDDITTSLDKFGNENKHSKGSERYPNNDAENNGFRLPDIPSGDGNGLPSSKAPYNRTAVSKRPIIHWFVPEIGVVKMYVNPSRIVYNYSKIIDQVQTKGGFSLQYWGEKLPTLSISGTTGSSGIEGINVLYEIYRAEQLVFDNFGLTLASNNNAAGGLAEDIVGGLGSAIGGVAGEGISKGLFGLDSSMNALAQNNIPSLAQYAFGIEFFYQGWVHRGYFNNMNITESADNVGLFSYELSFTVTQRRGYRYNNMPWHKSPYHGPSGSGIPYSFNGMKR